MDDIGHWLCPFVFDPTEWFGFIYKIIDNKTGKHYIGKKQFMSTTRKTVVGRRNKRIIRKQSNWRTYTSSSQYVNDEIALRSILDFSFIIVSLHETKSSLHYAEVKLQIEEDVLRAKLPNGLKKYYNACIGNMRFALKDETLMESQHKS